MAKQATQDGRPPHTAQAAVMDAIVTELSQRADPGERDLAATFGRLFLSKAPPEFFEDRDAPALAALTLGTLRMLQRSRPGRVDVEVFNPDGANEAWRAPVTVLRTDVSERPFIVDTIREYLHAEDLAIERFLHPVLQVVRKQDGSIASLAPASAGEPRESLVYCEIARVDDADRLERIRLTVRDNLADVVRATDDFQPMEGALDDTIAYLKDLAQRFPDHRDEAQEIEEFLLWLRDGGFVFLGYRSYDMVSTKRGRAIRVEPGSGLGILRDATSSTFQKPVLLSRLKPGLRERVEGGPLLITSKTNALSTVHRRARMDYVGVKKLDARGHITGERRFIGLFTSVAYSQDAARIPILRRKLAAILEQAGAIPGSHDYKEIITIFNSMPKEELFLASAEQIGREIESVLAVYHTHETRVTLRPDPLERGVSIMVIMPKERFSGDVRKAIEDAFVTRLEGEVLNYHLALGSGDQARLHFYISASPERVSEVEPVELEKIVEGLTRSWRDRVQAGLEEIRPGDEARRLAQRYSSAFSPEYQAATEPDVAETDILELEAMQGEARDAAIALSNPDVPEGIAVDEPVSQLKLFLRGGKLVLSDFMPILDNAGLRVIAMTPFEVAGPGVSKASIYVFAVQDTAGRPIDLVERAGRLSDMLLAVWQGAATNDPLNALVLIAGLSWREVELLRAYAEYAFQLGAVPSRLSLVSALRAYPAAARLLVDFFATKFDTELSLGRRERERHITAMGRDLQRLLEGVSSLSDDRALRRLALLMESTVRTNYYRHGGVRPVATSGGAPYISLKLSSDGLGSIVRTRLRYEVWVQSPRMSGVHLRGAKVARGGIRYSDRPDDFRTEVLGLVRTQMVKNAVIVPSGSKGGFITKRRLTDRDAMAQEVTAQYQTLMRGLLDLTDNLAEGDVVHPPGVLVYDEPDPYLVVAADKGTAHLSDVANAVAAEYDFWLDDAFASGGSHGYDHKKVGITARGGWECVRRHFREMGRDTQTEPFTAVGIGDMSGDVFGNGMLLSHETRLIAAFDHRHIFVDPAPDPESSFRERERLFNAGRTSWGDYDRSVLGPDGFIVARGAKEVDLPPSVRGALGLESTIERLDGEALIRAILAAPVDLLWNGGIGTYVKASDETHADVGDSANDPVRIDATQLRARVVGEGGNLGLTQRARVQYALAGGRLNTDAIDNSGGVDMSDHEVNLKILLGGAVASRRMSRKRRNELLEQLTEPVTQLVLRDNRSQSLALSLEQQRARETPDSFLDLLAQLEREGLLDRSAEALPSAEELMQRRSSGHDLTRPELSVLLAYGKLWLKQHLLASDLPDDDAAGRYLIEYFPAAALEGAGEAALTQHRLRREIVVTQLTNDLVDIMGVGFVSNTVRDTGVRPETAVRAWLIASQLCGARALRDSLEDVEGTLPSVEVYRWLRGLERVLERTARWVLANVPPDVPSTEFIEQHVEGLASLRAQFASIVAGEERATYEERVDEMAAITDRTDLAQRLITLRFLDQLLEILRVARESGSDPVRVGRAYYLSSELMDIPWLRRRLAEVASDNRWDQRWANAILDELGRSHRLVTQLVVAEGAGSMEPEPALQRVRERQASQLAAYHRLVNEIRADPEAGLASLSIAVRELEAAFGGH
jgi:glutamate dehydrogenase